MITDRATAALLAHRALPVMLADTSAATFLAYVWRSAVLALFGDSLGAKFFPRVAFQASLQAAPKTIDLVAVLEELLLACNALDCLVLSCHLGCLRISRIFSVSNMSFHKLR